MLSSMSKLFKLLRKNEAAQSALRRQLTTIDSKMGGANQYAQGNPRRAAFRFAGIGEKACALEIRASKTPEMSWTAQGIAEICHLCGFRVSISIRGNAPETGGISLESHADSACLALLLQGAFRIAQIGATLFVHRDARPDVVTLHLGEAVF